MERTKNNFIAHYKRALMDTYEWARDPVKLERFIEGVCETLNTDIKRWNFQGGCTDAARKAIGDKRSTSLSNLRKYDGVADPNTPPVAALPDIKGLYSRHDMPGQVI